MRNIISKLVKIWSVILITLLLPSVSQAAIQASIALKNNMVITPAPLDPLEVNGEGSATFSIVENLGGTVPELTIFNEPSTVLIINFANLTLKNGDVSLISGPMLDYYTPVYDVANDTLYFNQSADIPMLTSFDVNIPIEVTGNTPQENPNNLIEVNIQTNSNVVLGDGFSKAVTYTSVLAPEAPLVTLIDATDVNETDPTTVLTKDPTPEINGICIAGDTVTVQIDGTDITPTTRCTPAGTFSITPDTDIPEGEHNVTATQTDPENNLTSEPSPVDYLIVDTTPPAPLTIETVDGKTGSPVTTTDTTPEINGTCAYDDNGIVTVQIDGVDIAPTALCTVDGTYSVIPTTPLTIGEHNVTATETDEAGNTATTPVKELIIVLPEAPLVTLIDATDVNETDPTTVLTKDPTPEINGTCTASDTVTVQIDGTDIMPTTVCTPAGTFSITPDTEIPDGSHTVTATQTDENNVRSNPSPVDNLIVNTQVSDYKPTVILTGSPITGSSGDITLVVKVGEFLGGMNASAVKIFIPNNDNLVFTFDQTATQIGLDQVNNVEWNMTIISGGYLFEYIGNNGAYPPATIRSIGLQGLFTSSDNQSGNVSIEATILTGNGEIEFTNNKDTSTVSFNNVN